MHLLSHLHLSNLHLSYPDRWHQEKQKQKNAITPIIKYPAKAPIITEGVTFVDRNKSLKRKKVIKEKYVKRNKYAASSSSFDFLKLFHRNIKTSNAATNP